MILTRQKISFDIFQLLHRWIDRVKPPLWGRTSLWGRKMQERHVRNKTHFLTVSTCLLFQAHSPLPFLHNISLERTTQSVSRPSLTSEAHSFSPPLEANIQMQLYLFVSKLSGEPIGLTALKIHVIDKPFLLTVSFISSNFQHTMLILQTQETRGLDLWVTYPCWLNAPQLWWPVKWLAELPFFCEISASVSFMCKSSATTLATNPVLS